MAITRKDEWIIEGAWIAALEANNDLDGVDIRRAYDNSSDPGYEGVTVECVGIVDDLGKRQSKSRGDVYLSAWTTIDSDQSGERCAELIGAVRDTLQGDNLLSQMETDGNIKMYDVLNNEPSLRGEADGLQMRVIITDCRFSTVHGLPEE